MSVIAHLRIPADSFELGRIVPLEGKTNIALNAMVPLGEEAVPLFTVYNDGGGSFKDRVSDHPSVKSIKTVSSHEDETVFALNWNIERDIFFQGMLEVGAHLLSATGAGDWWKFEIRFRDHEALKEFQEYCHGGRIQLDLRRIYNPTKPDSGEWYGLSSAQRDTLLRAVQTGYYSIPRQISTQDLADEFDISDQAVTERLRRAIMELVENTLMAANEGDETFEAIQ